MLIILLLHNLVGAHSVVYNLPILVRIRAERGRELCARCARPAGSELCAEGVVRFFFFAEHALGLGRESMGFIVLGRLAHIKSRFSIESRFNP